MVLASQPLLLQYTREVAQSLFSPTLFKHTFLVAQGYDSVESKLLAVRSLKYMLLMKILMNEASDVPNIVTGKLALKYAGRSWDLLLPRAHASSVDSTRTRRTSVQYTYLTLFPCARTPRPRARGHAGCGERQLGPVSRRL